MKYNEKYLKQRIVEICVTNILSQHVPSYNKLLLRNDKIQLEYKYLQKRILLVSKLYWIIIRSVVSYTFICRTLIFYVITEPLTSETAHTNPTWNTDNCVCIFSSLLMPFHTDNWCFMFQISHIWFWQGISDRVMDHRSSRRVKEKENMRIMFYTHLQKLLFHPKFHHKHVQFHHGILLLHPVWCQHLLRLGKSGFLTCCNSEMTKLS
jgi:hypothetical protein